MFIPPQKLFLITWIFVVTTLTACGGNSGSTANTHAGGKGGSEIKTIKNLTLFVHGFDKDGYKASGVFGDKHPDEALEKFQALGQNYPASKDKVVINITKATTYYGDTPPDYYSEKDKQELKQVTAQWDGGIPRYAMIVAKYAKHLMIQEKVDRINIVSGSMGSLVTRWMIEKDVEGLASDKR